MHAITGKLPIGSPVILKLKDHEWAAAQPEIFKKEVQFFKKQPALVAWYPTAVNIFWSLMKGSV